MYEALKNAKRLTGKVAIYVPTRTRDGNHAFDCTNKVVTYLSDNFGGATILPANGAWISKSGDTVREDVYVVYAYTDRLSDAAIRGIVALCESIKRIADQESIAIEIDSTLYLI